MIVIEAEGLEAKDPNGESTKPIEKRPVCVSVMFSFPRVERFKCETGKLLLIDSIKICIVVSSFCVPLHVAGGFDRFQ